jgi:flagellar basal-body rod protein FlgC
MINSSLSGLRVAQTVLSVSSDNIANFKSTGTYKNGEVTSQPYQAMRVQQTTLADGSVQAVVMPVDPALLKQYEPESQAANAEGYVSYPNVNLETEAVTQLEARHAFKANIEMLERGQQVMAELLDILG